MASTTNNEEQMEMQQTGTNPDVAAESQSESGISQEFQMMAQDICKDLSQEECTYLLSMIAERQKTIGDGGEVSMTDYESAKGME